MRENEQDVGPYRIDLIRAIWNRVARMIESLHAIGAVKSSLRELDATLVSAAALGSMVDDSEITKVLRVLAGQDNMHAGDWLRARAVEAQMPRRKPPAALELQIRLKGLQCKRLVARCDGDGESYRVTIANVRGDVVSCHSTSFANSLEGAIKMAGARSETDDEDNRG